MTSAPTTGGASAPQANRTTAGAAKPPPHRAAIAAAFAATFASAWHVSASVQ